MMLDTRARLERKSQSEYGKCTGHLGTGTVVSQTKEGDKKGKKKGYGG